MFIDLDPEGLPIVVLEVLAARTPIVATGVGGVGEAVGDGGTGVLVEADKPSALGAALAQVLLDLELQECFTAAGWERARAHFSFEAMAVRCLALNRKVLAR